MKAAAPAHAQIARVRGTAVFLTRTERDAWVMHNLNLVQMAHAKDKRPACVVNGMAELELVIDEVDADGTVLNAGMRITEGRIGVTGK